VEVIKRASERLRRLVEKGRRKVAVHRSVDPESSYSRLALRLERDLPVTGQGRAVLVAGVEDDGIGVEGITELAWYLAEQLGHSVLIVDGTFGPGALSAALGIVEGPGVTELIGAPDVDRAAIAGASHPTEHESIRVLPRGHGDNGRVIPARSASLRRVIEAAREGYDFVLVQASLLEPSSRSLAFGAFVDAALLIAVEGRTSMETVERGQRMLNECGAERVGLVLASPPEAMPPNPA
jgi:Mrp family chromosome partitioning ATPase